MGFRSALGAAREDGTLVDANWDLVGKYLREKYLDNDLEDQRRAAMLERLDFYRDDAMAHLEKHVREIFVSREISANLCKLLPFAGSNNVTRRIVKLVATVYQTHATRLLLDEAQTELDADEEEDIANAGPEIPPESERQRTYSAIERETQKHRKMRLAQRMAMLMNAVAIYPRLVAGSGRRELRVVLQHAFWAVAHPRDPAELVGFVFEQRPVVAHERADDPCYLAMDDEVYFRLDRQKRIISSTINEHGLGMIPAILAQNELVDDCLLDWRSGGDIIRGHKAACFLDLMMLASQKDGTKMGYLAGDGTDRMGEGQPLDSGFLATIPEGVQPGVLDLGDDPQGKIRAAEQIVRTLAANYNIPVSVFMQSVQATSGDHLAILKSGLSESRAERIDDWRDIEARLAVLESKVYGIDTSGFASDFGEVAVIRGRKETLDIRKQERSMGLSNAVDEMLEDNPDLNEAQAELALMRNVEKTAKFVKRLRALNMPASPTSEDPGQDPQQNGGLRLVGDAPGATGRANGSSEAVETTNAT